MGWLATAGVLPVAASHSWRSKLTILFNGFPRNIGPKRRKLAAEILFEIDKTLLLFNETLARHMFIALFLLSSSFVKH